MIDLERMSLAEKRAIVNDAVLYLLGELEKFSELPKRKFKTEKDSRKVCEEASRLLSKLRVRGISNKDLSASPQFNRYIQALKTLNNESEQEYIDTAVVKIEYGNIVKNTPNIIEMLTEYYIFHGPESDKGILEEE